MKFRFNPKKFKIRMGIWLTFAFSIFSLIVILKFLLPVSFKSIDTCIKDSGTILRTEEITYFDISPIKKQKIKSRAVLISLREKPYKIWLTANKKYWNTINNNNNLGKSINYYYVSRLLQDTILYNPMRLDINGIEIIKFELEQKKSILAALSMLFLLFISSFVFITCILTYKDLLLRDDLILWNTHGIKPKLKMIFNWMRN